MTLSTLFKRIAALEKADGPRLMAVLCQDHNDATRYAATIDGRAVGMFGGPEDFRLWLKAEYPGRRYRLIVLEYAEKGAEAEQ